MTSGLAGRTAIVTGSSRGIGEGIAKRLAAEGMQVVLTGRDHAALQQVQAAILETGGQAGTIVLDLRDPESAERLTAFALDRFGSIDLVVNNAGATKRGDLLQLTDADFADGFALKYFGAVRLTRAAWPYLKAGAKRQTPNRENQGSVIFISGVGGKTPGAEFAVGGSVNAALHSLTKAVAETGRRDGVRVNLINPGTIRTARYELRRNKLAAESGLDPDTAEQAYVERQRITRIGEPSDIAALVAFLASDEARLMHGALIDMDAGATKSI